MQREEVVRKIAKACGEKRVCRLLTPGALPKRETDLPSRKDVRSSKDVLRR